mgnify:CR=1 FL=1
MKVAVIMCVWNRFHLLGKTLNMLNNQTDINFEVFIWNNNQKIKNLKDNLAINFNKLKFKISFKDHKQNIGGVGRFYMANHISKYYDYVIFIDDDQEFDKNLIKDFKNEASSTTINGWWAWETKNNYFNRRPLNVGEEGDYIGTGGMICPIEPFRIKEFFTNLPKKYLFVEDIWLSWYCKNKLGYKLKKSKAKINFSPNEIIRDQSHNLNGLKEEFYTYLKNLK